MLNYWMEKRVISASSSGAARVAKEYAGQPLLVKLWLAAKPWSIPSTCVPSSFPLLRDAWFKRKTVVHTFPFIASQTAKTSMTAS